MKTNKLIVVFCETVIDCNNFFNDNPKNIHKHKAIAQSAKHRSLWLLWPNGQIQFVSGDMHESISGFDVVRYDVFPKTGAKTNHDYD